VAFPDAQTKRHDWHVASDELNAFRHDEWPDFVMTNGPISARFRHDEWPDCVMTKCGNFVSDAPDGGGDHSISPWPSQITWPRSILRSVSVETKT